MFQYEPLNIVPWNIYIYMHHENMSTRKKKAWYSKTKTLGKIMGERINWRKKTKIFF